MSPPSGVWTYFEKTAGGKKVVCNKCKKELTYCNSTSSLANHLQKQHKITIVGQKRKLNSPDRLSEESVDVPSEDLGDSNPTSPTSAGCGTTPQASVAKEPKSARGPMGTWLENCTSFKEGGQKREAVNDALIYMIAVDNMPFSTPEKRGMKMFVKKLNPMYKLPCETTTTKLMEAKYSKLKLKFGAMIKASRAIVLTTDLWTETMSTRGFLGLTAHILEGTAMRAIHLGARLMPQRKTIANLVEVLSELCAEWQIDVAKVTAVVTDRGSNIKGAVRQLFGPGKHFACFAHLLNTIATDAIGFYAKAGADAEMDDPLPAEEDSDDDEIPEETIPSDLKDIIRKLKKIVSFFRSSEVAKTELTALQIKEWGKTLTTALKLLQEVRTRWNSLYRMIDRYLHLSEFVGRILLKLSREKGSTKAKPPQDLTPEEVNTLTEVKSLLKPLYLATLELCSQKNVTLSKCIPLVCRMQQGLTSFMATDPIAFNLRARLLDNILKYFGPLKNNMFYTVATMLDPRFKKMYLETTTVISTMTRIKNLLKEKQAAEAIDRALHLDPLDDADEAFSVGTPASAPVPVRGEDDDVDLWGDHDQDVAAAAQGGVENSGEVGYQELLGYLKEPVCPRSVNPLEEWSTLKYKYPNLYEIAMDTLPILATSVPAERLFSKAGILITKQRNRLTGKHVEQMLFLSSVEEPLWFS